MAAFLPLLPIIGNVSRVKRFATAVVPKFINFYYKNINKAIKQGKKPDINRAISGLQQHRGMVLASEKAIKNESDRTKALKMIDEAILKIQNIKVPVKPGRATKVVSKEYEKGFNYQNVIRDTKATKFKNRIKKKY
tara:strand:- start:108 stop:515 length:408 start_codon:yes stop_codon:yes gene_type:complete